MLNFIIRPLLALAGVITGWFVATDATNFSLIQMAVAVVLLTLFVALAAFWETVMGWLRNRRRPG